ncbi:MAG: Re/Si-specific NAD(P)(+) transhydrogenase subunit alpha [Candidatus Zixiibacteriota bacterium]|nr:MAG: Re/Si-specific NAD(P)(+) transhydrogenase subunit alpha [candidate division Zixibacteria bacterium]
MIVGVPKETFPGENRVAVIADTVPLFTKAGMPIVVESGAGLRAGITDEQYSQKGAEVVSDRKVVFDRGQVILQVRGFGANPTNGRSDLELFRTGQALVSFFEPLTAGDEVKAMAERGVSVFAVEMIPRIARAQSMDTLSSMATIAGYKAVLLAAGLLPKMFPMLMTAAGTISPARVFVIGAGVAGLQAIASAKRLGAIVKGYDVRPAVKEQVESLGASFIELEIEAGDSEDKGGYAREMDESFYRRQQELMARVVAESDVVITTAAVPGKKAPILITAEMVKGMHPGSVIIDLAAERGGNCELTRPDEKVDKAGVTVLGPTNVPSTVPFHASQMYSRNLLTFMKHLVKDGRLNFDMDDEITRDTLLTRDGEIVNSRLREIFGLEPTSERSDD